jgi:hypothetical protein
MHCCESHHVTFNSRNNRMPRTGQGPNCRSVAIAKTAANFSRLYATHRVDQL